MSDIKKVKGSKIHSIKMVHEKKSDNKRDNEEKIRKSVHCDDGSSLNCLQDELKVQKIKTHKIRKLIGNSEEQALDKVIENEDNISITVMFIILRVCFVVGMCLGYVLYQIAINSSNAMLIITHFLS